MTSDLLFSVLPREGKVPIAHDKQKVHKISKQGKLKPLNDQEQELKVEEREAREKQMHQGKNHQEHSKQRGEIEDALSLEQKNEVKDTKGPKHLDIYV